jgi:hypothetical protein
VYDYLTKCLYKKASFKGSKSWKAVLKSISYFSAKEIKLISKDSRLKNQIEKEFGLNTKQEGPYDLIYLDFPQADILSNYRNEIHNDSLIFINNIHKNEERTCIWKTLVEQKLVTVSIDTFHAGMLFFRKEQVKEHFKIRI